MVLYILLLGVALLLLSTVIRGAPFVPTHSDRVSTMVKLAEIRPGEQALDLGSGDGRLVMAMARAGAIAHGYEINPLLVWWSRYRIYKAGLSGRAFVHWGNFWTKNFADFDVITVFGIGRIMGELEAKLRQELAPGARVISYVFAFPTWRPVLKDGAIFVYRR